MGKKVALGKMEKRRDLGATENNVNSMYQMLARMLFCCITAQGPVKMYYSTAVNQRKILHFMSHLRKAYLVILTI